MERALDASETGDTCCSGQSGDGNKGQKDSDEQMRDVSDEPEGSFCKIFFSVLFFIFLTVFARSLSLYWMKFIISVNSIILNIWNIFLKTDLLSPGLFIVAGMRNKAWNRTFSNKMKQQESLI